MKRGREEMCLDVCKNVLIAFTGQVVVCVAATGSLQVDLYGAVFDALIHIVKLSEAMAMSLLRRWHLGW